VPGPSATAIEFVVFVSDQTLWGASCWFLPLWVCGCVGGSCAFARCPPSVPHTRTVHLIDTGSAITSNFLRIKRDSPSPNCCSPPLMNFYQTTASYNNLISPIRVGEPGLLETDPVRLASDHLLPALLVWPLRRASSPNYFRVRPYMRGRCVLHSSKPTRQLQKERRKNDNRTRRR